MVWSQNCWLPMGAPRRVNEVVELEVRPGGKGPRLTAESMPPHGMSSHLAGLMWRPRPNAGEANIIQIGHEDTLLVREPGRCRFEGRLKSQGEEQRAEGVPLLHPRFRSQHGAVEEQPAVVGIAPLSPGRQSREAQSNLTEHGSPVEGVEGIGEVSWRVEER